MRFYDPVDEADLQRVTALLSRGGIEYVLRSTPGSGLRPDEVHVAEEDLAAAEEIINRAQRH